MPSQGQDVIFSAGLQENYDTIGSKNLNTVYFCTDTQRLFLGETEYTRPIQYGTTLPEEFMPPNSLFYKSDTQSLYYSKDGESWGTVSNFYTHPSFTARTLGTQTGSTLSWGGTFKVPSISVNAQGHVSSGSDVTFTMPAAPTTSVTATTSGNGNVVTAITAQNSTITVTKGATMATSSELAAVKTKADNAMPKSGGTFTGAITVPNPTSTGHAATKQYVDTAKSDAISQSKSYADGLIAANDAMVFKGTIGTSGTVTALPATHSVGWTYRVITAGSYAGQNCEVGDLIICITDGTSANNAHWTVAQTNIDGAVTHDAALTADRIILGDGSGSIKASSTALSSLATTSQLNNKVDKTTTVNGHALSDDVTVTKSDIGLGNVDNTADSIKSVASAAKLTTARTINGVSFDGTKNITIPVPDALNDLNDVSVSSPANNQALIYNSTESKWKNLSLSKSLVGLGNVDNTADSSKSVASAAKLTTARKISLTGNATGSTSFNGSADVSISVTVNTATKATQDAAGNVITTTYATKSELNSAKLVWQTF